MANTWRIPLMRNALIDGKDYLGAFGQKVDEALGALRSITADEYDSTIHNIPHIDELLDYLVSKTNFEYDDLTQEDDQDI